MGSPISFSSFFSSSASDRTVSDTMKFAYKNCGKAGMDKNQFLAFVNSLLGIKGKAAMKLGGDKATNYIGNYFNRIAGQDEDKNHVSEVELSSFLKNAFGLELNNYSDRSLELLVDDIQRVDEHKKPIYNRPKLKVKGTEIGQHIYQGVKGLGTRDYIYTDLKEKVNKDTVLGTIIGFNEASPKEHIMHYLADDGVHEGIASRVPKALLRKAKDAGLENTPEYKALAEYYGAKGTPSYNADGSINTKKDTFTLTKHCDDNKKLEEGAEATKVDNMMSDLVELLIQ